MGERNPTGFYAYKRLDEPPWHEWRHSPSVDQIKVVVDGSVGPFDQPMFLIQEERTGLLTVRTERGAIKVIPQAANTVLLGVEGWQAHIESQIKQRTRRARQ